MCDRSEYLIPTLQLFQHMKHSPLQWQQTPSCCSFSTSLSIFHTLAHWLPGLTDIPVLTRCFHMQRASWEIMQGLVFKPLRWHSLPRSHRHRRNEVKRQQIIFRNLRRMCHLYFSYQGTKLRQVSPTSKLE